MSHRHSNVITAHCSTTTGKLTAVALHQFDAGSRRPYPVAGQRCIALRLSRPTNTVEANITYAAS